MPKKYLIAGGDMRFAALAEQLADEGSIVYTLGFDAETINSDKPYIAGNIHDLPDKADYLILPIPVSNDDKYVNTPCSDKSVSLNDTVSLIENNGIVFGGKISPYVNEFFTSHGFTVYDYLYREELSVMNALATAEGALQIALQEQPVILSGEKILILGMGRISKALIRLLSGFGADITIAARKYSDLAWAEVYGCRSIRICELDNSAIIENADLIFNTVPYPIFGTDLLEKCRKDCLLIDLASKPGGIDIKKAGDLGLRAIWALSLPGKTAPISSGRMISEAIKNILRERSDIL